MIESEGRLITQINIDEKRVADFCRRWGVRELAVFGSVLRDDFRPESDVDVLASFAPGARHTLFELGHMEAELASIFGRKVELVERDAVEKSENYIRRREILNSARPIHVA